MSKVGHVIVDNGAPCCFQHGGKKAERKQTGKELALSLSPKCFLRCDAKSFGFILWPVLIASGVYFLRRAAFEGLEAVQFPVQLVAPVFPISLSRYEELISCGRPCH